MELQVATSRNDKLISIKALTFQSAGPNYSIDLSPNRKPAKLRILVVDDRKEVADMLGLFLEAVGHRVQVCYEGANCVQEFQRFAPQVVFLDLGMPDMSGFEVAQQLRSHPNHATLIALSALVRQLQRMGTTFTKATCANEGARWRFD